MIVRPVSLYDTPLYSLYLKHTYVPWVISSVLLLHRNSEHFLENIWKGNTGTRGIFGGYTEPTEVSGIPVSISYRIVP